MHRYVYMMSLILSPFPIYPPFVSDLELFGEFLIEKISIP